ncbi:hypothetical protein FM037_08735 [Shewanella psychropiezotolerans]|uniref:Uncharacterized protein n=1 Tax=Shewanella psychropiezotolerans TaxID=2593655 RepID=A0ABX5WW84_9GAMM|nr:MULTISPECIES: hypothetical protein [Shewanella]MPY22372.1 hypothetical protein [Shewanella sp. YLB-07]QDO83299.1 hypothetical protein FM037_08735 [Shewanella psychropiezotolerans]
MPQTSYELDAESIESLQSLIGQEINLLTKSVDINFSQGNATCLSPLYFRVEAGFVEMTNEWNTSPQGHDFHLPIFRKVLQPTEIEYSVIDHSIGPCSEIKLTEKVGVIIDSIAILRLSCQCAIVDKTKAGGWVPSDEIITYDWGINIKLSDGTSVSMTTEDDSILGELIISPLAIEPYYKEDVWVEKLDIRLGLT